MLLQIIVLVADFAILGTYARVSVGRSVRPFHWANAIGAVPVVALEVLTGAWAVIPLTATFGLLGVTGLLKGTK